jgi:hypothetical protein
MCKLPSSLSLSLLPGLPGIREIEGGPAEMLNVGKNKGANIKFSDDIQEK